MGEVRRDDGKRNMFWRSGSRGPAPTPVHNARRRLTLAKSARPSQIWAGRGSYPANAGLILVMRLRAAGTGVVAAGRAISRLGRRGFLGGNLDILGDARLDLEGCLVGFVGM